MHKRILLVEDDSDDQAFFVNAANRVSPILECDIAANGEEALKMVSLYPFYEFIFMDLNMPVMDGSTCLAKLKASQYKKIPVVIFTTSKSERDIERCKTLGVAMYWLKPHSEETLFKELQRIVKTEINILSANGYNFLHGTI